VQRLRLPAPAVEGEHELSAQALPQPIRRNQALHLRDQIHVPAELEVGFDALLQCSQAHLLDPGRRFAGEALVAEVGERLAAEEGEGGTQEFTPPSRVVLLSRSRGQGLETTDIQLFGPYPERVAVRLGLDRLRPQQLSERRDMSVQGGRCRLWRRFAPQRLEQIVGGNDLVRP
jgi:hypothetical protein